MDINKLIDKYGTTVAHQLQIATSQVYSVVLVYIRLNAAINFLVIISILIYMFIYTKCVVGFVKKHNWYDEEEKGFAIAGFSLLGIFSTLIFWAIIYQLIYAGIQVVYPQYWIIDQIVNKLQ